jgi:hypothetical protein
MSAERAGLNGLFSKAQLEALEDAAGDMSLEDWSRRVLLTAAGRPEDDEFALDEARAAPVPVSTAPPTTAPSEPNLAEVARRLDELRAEMRSKLLAMANLLEEMRETQLQWQEAIFAEICAHTAFPDERARRLGLAKAERDMRAARDRISQAVARARRERREAMARTPATI